MQKVKIIFRLRATLALLATGLAAHLAAQGGYFQQETGYTIHVRLDDTSHVLHGHLTLEYTNNAPHALDTLWLHLWPNAYSSRQTAFAKQARAIGSLDFQFAPKSQLGGIDSLSFAQDGNATPWRPHPEHPDIAFILLPSPILPGASTTITTPFRVKLPKVFSRLGHTGQSYQITQWHPKPAVYDASGWHPMPYLDMGEFYSEFGTYTVHITLADRYTVAATGTLQTLEEQERLQALSQNQTVGHSGRLKTLTYTADRVHDFAWFADARYQVRQDTVQLPNGDSVQAWAFFLDGSSSYWAKAVPFLKRALRFYSQQVGSYPYPQATVVETEAGAGGGMEYPMITNISGAFDEQSLDILIAHEVGHNWFYGILGSNERDHAWMDEGLNSYYEQRYARTYYPGQNTLLPEVIMRRTPIQERELGYLFQARRHLEQAPATPSGALSPANYFVGAYEKPALALHHLQGYLGREKMDSLMQSYFEAWSFRHPQPQNFKQHLEAGSKENLDWLFDGLIGSAQPLDYAIRKVERRGRSVKVTVRNRGGFAAPIPIALMQGDTVLSQEWSSGFSGQRTFRLRGKAADAIVIDPERLTPDLRRYNNRRQLEGLSLPKLHFLAGLNSDESANLFLSPAGGWNAHDGWMAGLLAYNSAVPERPFEFQLAPAWGFNSRQLAGLGHLGYHFYPNALQRLSVGLRARQFSYRNGGAAAPTLSYRRWQPYLTADFKPNFSATARCQLELSTLWLDREAFSFADPASPSLDRDPARLQQARFTFEQYRRFNPYSWTFLLEHQGFEDAFGESQRYVKATAMIDWDFHYAPRAAVHLRLYGGYFLYSTFREAGFTSPFALNLISQGHNDYRYEGLFLDRQAAGTFAANQLLTHEGGFKTPIGPGFPLGRSNNWVAALNFSIDLPPDALLGIPIKPYLDLGYFDNAMPTGQSDTFADQFVWNGGFLLSVADEALAIYLPVISSANLGDRLAERGSFLQRIGFQVNFQKLNPWRIRDRITY